MSAITASQLQAYTAWKNAGVPLTALGDAFLGLDASGTTDVTVALQGYLDIAYSVGVEAVIGPGTWLVSGLTIYSGMTVRFMPGATLKMSTTGPCLATLPSPGAVAGSAFCHNIAINYPNINQNGQSGCAILLESNEHAHILQPQITGVAATGTWSHVNSPGTQVLPNAGLMLLGNPSTGNYYNEIIDPFIREGFTPTGGGTAGTGGIGLWIGTSLVGAGTPGAKGNFNTVYGGNITGYTTGIYIQAGSDIRLVQNDCSENTTGFVIGEVAAGFPVKRTRIYQPYIELCTTGIHFTTEAQNNYVYGMAATSTTTIPFLDDESETDADSGNVVIDSIGPDWGPPQSATVTDGWRIAGSNSFSSVVPLRGENSSGGYQVQLVGGQEVSGYQGPQFWGVSYNGAIGATTATANNDHLVTIAGFGYEITTPTIARGGRVKLKAVEAWTNTTQGTQWELEVVQPTTTTKQVVATFGYKTSFMQSGLGFWATTPPTSQPTVTGSRGGNAALASLLTILASYGLFIDGSS